MRYKLALWILIGCMAISVTTAYAETTAGDGIVSPQAGISAALSGFSEETALLYDVSVSPDNIESFVDGDKKQENDTLAVSKSTKPLFLFQNNSLDGNVVGMLPEGGAGNILAEGEDWYLVRSGYYAGFMAKSDLMTGKDATDYANKNFCKEATITVNTSFAYENQDCSGAVLAVMGNNNIVRVEASGDEGSYAIVIGDTTGYIRCGDVSVSNIYKTAKEPDLTVYADMYPEKALSTYGSEEEYDSQTAPGITVTAAPSADCLSLMQELVNYAMQFLGNPYVWGGESLTDGCDCSGFVMKIFEYFGYSLPHGSFALRSVGEDVCGSTWKEEAALPGDIICYEGHVGIYIGNGQIIHAANKRDGIKISEVTYRSDFICARRVIFGRTATSAVSEDEYEILCRIVEAEAGGCPEAVRIEVADTILNRVASSRFPNSIRDVVFAPNQFTPVSNGRYYRVTVQQSTRDAVNQAINSADRSMGALYFMNPDYSEPKNVEWFHESLTYLFTDGGVEFFK